MLRWFPPAVVAVLLCAMLRGVPSVAAARDSFHANNPRFTGTPPVRVFNERELPGSPQTRSVLVHPDGLVYVANAGGLAEYDGESWRMIRGTEGRIVHNVACDGAGRIWYSGTDGFGRLVADERGELGAEPLHEKLPSADRNVGHVLRMLVTGEEAYFVTQGSRGAIARADARGGVRALVLPDGERAVGVFLHERAVYAIGTARTWRLEGEAFRPAPAAQALTTLGVFSVWPRAEGGAWIVSRGGLRVWQGEEAPLVSNDVATLLGGDRVSCGCPLGEGLFALGTEQHGVVLVEAATGRVLTRYDDDRGLGVASGNITAVTADRDGGLWVSRFGGMTRIQVQTPTAVHPDVRGRVQASVLHRGRLHVATTQGVFVREPATGRFGELPGVAGDTWVLLSTEEGLIVGGLDLRLLRDEGDVVIIEPERLLFRSALRLRRDPDRLVACTGPGLVRVYRREHGVWRFEAGLPKVRASLYPLVEDDAGWLWATRNRLEVVRLDWRAGPRVDATLETVGPALGLPLTVERRANVGIFLLGGEVEVTSDLGLWHHDAANDRFVAESRIEGFDPGRWPRAFPLRDGSLLLANLRPEDPSAIARRTGRSTWRVEPLAYTGLEAVRPLEVCDDPAADTVWIGHLGLASFDRGWRGERAPPPVVRLREITLGAAGRWWSGAGPLPVAPFAPDRNSLSFGFAAPSFQPDAFGEAVNHYRTRLDGFEREWSAWSRHAGRDTSTLPPGNFTLRVQARDRAGREGAELRFAFTVLPPWWRTWWFLGFAGASGVGAIAAATRWYAQRVMRRRLALLEAQAAVERERLRLARDLHDEVGSGLGRVILFAEEAERERADPVQLTASLARVRDSAKDLVQHAREIVWAVSPQHDPLARVIERLADYVEETLRAAGIACRIVVPTEPEEIPAVSLGSEARHSLFLAVKEAVHNCVKYSGAKTAEFRLAIVAGDLVVTLRDHGRGFAAGAIAAGGTGHGLPGLAARAAALGGRGEIVSAPGQGTTVTLRVPLVKPEA